MQYKEGQLIRMKEDCRLNSLKKGEICKLHYGDRDDKDKDTLYAWGEKKICSCQELWELVEDVKEEKTWDNLKVGDVIWDKVGRENKIVDWGVNKNYFFIGNGYETGGWSKQELIDRGYTPTPPQETITKQEAEKILNKIIKD